MPAKEQIGLSPSERRNLSELLSSAPIVSAFAKVMENCQTAALAYSLSEDDRGKALQELWALRRLQNRFSQITKKE